jgi:hypothetical protein
MQAKQRQNPSRRWVMEHARFLKTRPEPVERLATGETVPWGVRGCRLVVGVQVGEAIGVVSGGT